jgi:hypothetical protein
MSRTGDLLDPKDILEVDIITFDFSVKLNTGETILASPAPIVTSEVFAGVDPEPSGVIAGVTEQSGDNIILQEILAGVVGVSYLIRCTVSTSQERKLTLSCILPVVKM